MFLVKRGTGPKTFYTYLIVDPRNMEPVYVGKGSNRRMKEHWQCMLRDQRNVNRRLFNKLTDIFVAGFTSPIYVTLFETPFQNAAFAMEAFWIAVIGRWNLCNIRDGGGSSEYAPETGEAISRALKGIKRSDETRKNMSIAKLNMSDEHRKNLSASGKGRVFSEEHKRKMSAWQIGRKLTPSHIENTRRGRSHRHFLLKASGTMPLF
jgi:hypothetical protein